MDLSYASQVSPFILNSVLMSIVCSLLWLGLMPQCLVARERLTLALQNHQDYIEGRQHSPQPRNEHPMAFKRSHLHRLRRHYQITSLSLNVCLFALLSYLVNVCVLSIIILFSLHRAFVLGALWLFGLGALMLCASVVLFVLSLLIAHKIAVPTGVEMAEAKSSPIASERSFSGLMLKQRKASRRASTMQLLS